MKALIQLQAIQNNIFNSKILTPETSKFLHYKVHMFHFTYSTNKKNGYFYDSHFLFHARMPLRNLALSLQHQLMQHGNSQAAVALGKFAFRISAQMDLKNEIHMLRLVRRSTQNVSIRNYPKNLVHWNNLSQQQSRDHHCYTRMY